MIPMKKFTAIQNSLLSKELYYSEVMEPTSTLKNIAWLYLNNNVTLPIGPKQIKCCT